MLPSLPLLAPPPRAALLGALLLAGAAAAAAAGELELWLGPPRANGGYVWADVRIGELFEPRVEQSLSRGMPATLELHTELWRRRRAWFDRLEGSYDVSFRIRYEVWNNWYRIERAGAPALTLGTLDSVSTALSRPFSLPAGRLDRLPRDASCYLVVTATLRPLSVEDVEEVEGWLSGEVETKRRAGFGVITELPRSVFDAVRNFAGFGDHRARAISDDFEPGTLVGER